MPETTSPVPASRIAATSVRISEKTIWIFVDVTFADGVTGTGEATLPGRETALLAVADAQLQDWLQTQTLQRPVTAVTPLPEAALISALDVACQDAAGQRDGRPVSGGDTRPVPVSANINRRTVDRTPQGFAASARHAKAQGFTAFKIAPFDEVSVTLCRAGTGRAAMQPGLDRIAAVRQAIAPDDRLMVDCHWRFDRATAEVLIDAIRPFELYWLECPLPEEPGTIADLVALRRRLNAHGVRLAGLEEFVGCDSFLAYARPGAYDVMMPDTKYVGGFREMQRTAESLSKLGIEISPHNPTGPICHAASLHASAGLAGFTMLEMQLDETPLFWDLATPPLPRPEAGQHALPQGPGLGIALDRDLMQSLVLATRHYIA